MTPTARTAGPTREQCAYAAGLMDGDGCISISMNYRKGTYTWQLCVEQIDKAAVLWMKQRFGGKLYSTKQGAWRWFEGRRDRCQEICGLIFPFLILKQKQAGLMIDDAIVSKRGMSKKQKGIEERRRERLINSLKKLNSYRPAVFRGAK